MTSHHQRGHRGHGDFVAAHAKQVDEVTSSQEGHGVCNASAIVENMDGDALRDPDRVEHQEQAVITTDYFVFRLHGRTYAVAPSSVESVVPLQRIVPVPTVGAHVRGVVHSRGRIIAVVDLAALLGIDEGTAATESARMIVASGRSPFAFVADVTLGIWACAEHTRNSDDGPLVLGRINNDGEAATVVDPRAVIDRVVTLRTERP